MRKKRERGQTKLALQIRISYLFLLIPIMIFLVYVLIVSTFFGEMLIEGSTQAESPE